MTDIGEAQKRVGELNRRFASVRKRQWSPEVMFADLSEEVGELANAILTREGFKSGKRQKAELADSLCDILFDVLMIAGHYGIDMEKEHDKVFRGLEKRLEKGEFSD
jgi:NTP pyrophosphatase (non-canonical NTP hydrolase)